MDELMGDKVRRWIAWGLLLLMALSLLGMLAYARGADHRRGDEIGTHGTPPPARSQ